MNTTDDGLLPYLTVRLCDDGSVETRASYAGNDELERLVSPVLALAAGLNTRTTPSPVTDDSLVEKVARAIAGAPSKPFSKIEWSAYPYQRERINEARAALAASDRDVLVGALEWIEAFAQIRSKDDGKVFARVNRGALRAIAERAGAALIPLAEESPS